MTTLKLTYQNNTLAADTSELVCGNDIYVTVSADKECNIVAEKEDEVFVFSSLEEKISLPFGFSEEEGYIKFTAEGEEGGAETFVYVRQSITSVKTSEGEETENGEDIPKEENTLHISLYGKELFFASGTQKVKIVEDNEDYFLKFSLDILYDALYCRIIKDRKYTDIPISKDGFVEIPKYLLKEGYIIVGLYNLSFATVPLHIHVCGSILGDFDAVPGVEPAPAEVDYSTVKNKPKINGVSVDGEKTGEDYGLENSIVWATNADIDKLFKK